MTEKQLIDGCIRRDERSQNAFYKAYFPFMTSIANRYYRNKDDVYRVVNYGFLKVFNNLEKYDPTYSLTTWMGRILINHIIDEFRKNEKYENQVPTEHIDKENNKGVSWNLVEHQWEQEDLLTMIESLPRATRTVFKLYAFEAYKHAEIAEVMGISENTSKWHLREARTRLKQLLEHTYKQGTKSHVKL